MIVGTIMARVTIEDCLEHVDNRFDLVLVASKRARQLSNGVQPMLDADNDKDTVVALREIAEGIVTSATLEQPEEEFVSDDDAIAAALEDTLGNM